MTSVWDPIIQTTKQDGWRSTQEPHLHMGFIFTSTVRYVGFRPLKLPDIQGVGTRKSA